MLALRHQRDVDERVKTMLIENLKHDDDQIQNQEVPNQTTVKVDAEHPTIEFEALMETETDPVSEYVFYLLVPLKYLLIYILNYRAATITEMQENNGTSNLQKIFQQLR